MVKLNVWPRSPTRYYQFVLVASMFGHLLVVCFLLGGKKGEKGGRFACYEETWKKGRRALLDSRIDMEWCFSGAGTNSRDKVGGGGEVRWLCTCIFRLSLPLFGRDEDLDIGFVLTRGSMHDRRAAHLFGLFNSLFSS